MSTAIKGEIKLWTATRQPSDWRLDYAQEPPAAPSGVGYEDSRRGIRISGVARSGFGGSIKLFIDCVRR